jgi:hypothetical protein
MTHARTRDFSSLHTQNNLKKGATCDDCASRGMQSRRRPPTLEDQPKLEESGQFFYEYAKSEILNAPNSVVAF